MDIRSYLRRAAYGLLFIDPVRFLFCKIRWTFLKGRIRTLDRHSPSVGHDAVKYNLSAFQHNAVFGMGRRMSLLIFPIAAFLKEALNSARVLIVGPRTEDDIFWARSLGLVETTGLDLFSYSRFIQLGDIHRTDYPSGTFDAVLLGWMISYSSDPQTVVDECKRILKPGGYLGIGIESNPALQGIDPPPAPRKNSLNSPAELMALVREPVACTNDPHDNVVYDCAVIFKVLKR
jgi:SAM-dependent methyltransferase